MFKKIVLVALTIVFSVYTAVFINAQENSTSLSTYKNQKIAGVSVNYIRLKADALITPKLGLAYDVIDSAQNVNDIISNAQNKGNIIAAFSGTFFDSYNGTNKTYGTLYQDGMLVNNGGYFSYLVYTTDNNWNILDRQQMQELSKDSIVIAVACDPRLIRNGVKSIEPGNEPESFITATAQRTLIGITANGDLVAAEGSMNFDKAADVLLELGCVEGMAMDGGASSFLYAGGTTIQQAGRNLNNIIIIYERESTPISTSVTFNGEPLKFDLPIINRDGRTYYPLRQLIEGIGGTVAWEGEIQKASGFLNGNTVDFFIDSSDYIVNGTPETMDAVPFNENGRTYIPIRYAAEALGLTVEWDVQTQTIKLQ